MRTLVTIPDIQKAAEQPVNCPLCGLVRDVDTCHLEITPKGTVNVRKGATCPDHGYFTRTVTVKAVQMHGTDAQIIPRHS